MKSGDLKLPGFRIFLISEIKELMFLRIKKENWMIESRKDGFWYILDNGTDFLLQRLPFEEYPEKQIGETLRNKKELKCVLNLIQALNSLIQKIGVNKLDEEYFDSPLMDDVIEAAKQAHAVLMKDEDLEALATAERVRGVE